MKIQHSGSDRFCAKAYYPDVSFLKGVAVLAIVACHIGELFENANQLIFYGLTVGQMACQLFFMASSLLLSFSYSANKPSYGSFLFKRAKRIAPPYWTAIIISLLLCYVGPVVGVDSYTRLGEAPWKIIINVLLLNGLTPYGNNDVVYGGWFVGTIVVFYLLFPLLFKLHCSLRARIKHTQTSLLILLALQTAFAVALRIVDITCTPLSFVYFSFLNQLTAFWTGFVLYDLYHEDRVKTVKHAFAKFFVSALLALAAYYGGYSLGWRDTFVFAPFLFSFSYIFLFAFVNQRLGGEKQPGFALQSIVRLGDRSYGVYLSHLFVLYTLGRATLGSLFYQLQLNPVLCMIIMLVLFVPLCCIVGVLFDRLFDRTKTPLVNTGG